MKPYPPLGLLYLSAFLKSAGYSVEVFDSTFERTRPVDGAVRARPRRRRRHLHQSHDSPHGAARSSAPPNSSAWTVVLGGPESANYVDEYLGRRRGRGRRSAKASSRSRELLPALPRVGPHRLQRRARHRIPRRDRRHRAHTRAHQGDGPRLPAVSRPRGDRSPALSRRLEDAPRREQHQSHHRARLPLSLQLVLARRVRLYASPPQPRECRRRDAVDHRSLRSRPGVVRRRRLHHQPSVACDLRRRAQEPRHPSAVRDHHARRPAAEHVAAVRLLRELGCYRIWIGSESGSQKNPRTPCSAASGRAGASSPSSSRRHTASRSACS